MYCHQMCSFNLKMHQNRFQPGLCPRPRWGSLRHSPVPSPWSSGEGQHLYRNICIAVGASILAHPMKNSFPRRCLALCGCCKFSKPLMRYFLDLILLENTVKCFLSILGVYLHFDPPTKNPLTFARTNVKDDGRRMKKLQCARRQVGLISRV